MRASLCVPTCLHIYICIYKPKTPALYIYIYMYIYPVSPQETSDWWQPGGVEESWDSWGEAKESKEKPNEGDCKEGEERDETWAWGGWQTKEKGHADWHAKEKGGYGNGGWRAKQEDQPREWQGTWKYKRAGDTSWTTQGPKRVKTEAWGAWHDEDEERSTTAE